MNRKPFVFLHARTPARAPVHRGGCMAPTRKKTEGQEENYDLISLSSHTDISLLKQIVLYETRTIIYKQNSTQIINQLSINKFKKYI